MLYLHLHLCDDVNRQDVDGCPHYSEQMVLVLGGQYFSY